MGTEDVNSFIITLSAEVLLLVILQNVQIQEEINEGREGKKVKGLLP